MNDYKATVLQLLADIGSADPPAGPVISTSQFHAEVLRLLGEIASAGGGGGGGGGGGTGWLVVNATRTSIDDPFVLDKTASELMDAAPFVICVSPNDYAPGIYEAGCLETWGVNDGTYGFQFGSEFYMTESLDGYPVGAGEQ